MAKYRMLVLSNAVDGGDDEFNKWYDQVHLPDVLKVPGITGAERYRILSGEGFRYLAIYELDCDDPAAVEKDLMSRAGTPAMTMSDTFDMSRMFMGTAEVITPFRTA